MKKMSDIFWNPNEHRLRALWRIVLQTIFWFAGTVILLLPVMPFLPDGETTIANEFDIALALQCPAILLAVWLAGRVLDRRRFSDFGITLGRGWWLDLGFGLFLGALLITLVFLIELTAGWLTITDTFAAPAGKSFGVAIIAPAVMFVLIGIQEEVLFRSYHLINIAEGLRGEPFGSRAAVIGAVLVTAVVFAAMHLFNAHAGPPPWQACSCSGSSPPRLRSGRRAGDSHRPAHHLKLLPGHSVRIPGEWRRPLAGNFCRRGSAWSGAVGRR